MSFAAAPLLRYQRQSERQTAEVISEEILLSKAYIENIGGTMLGVCTDNASNMRAACRLVPSAVWLGSAFNDDGRFIIFIIDPQPSFAFATHHTDFLGNKGGGKD